MTSPGNISIVCLSLKPEIHPKLLGEQTGKSSGYTLTQTLCRARHWYGYIPGCVHIHLEVILFEKRYKREEYEVGDVPSLSVFKRYLDNALNNML